jgi:hypothetical protein
MRQLRLLSVLFVLALSSPSPAAAAGPQLVVQSPAEGAVVEGSSVQVAFSATGLTIVPSTVPVSEAGKHPEANKPGEGHVHLVLDLQPLVIWEKTTPYTFANVPAGEHQLMVELVNNDHSSLTPPVMQRISFRSTAAVMQQLPNTGEAPWQPAVPMLLLGIVLLAAGQLVARRAGR